MTGTTGPRRFELGQAYRNSQVSPKGTIVVTRAGTWGSGAYFQTRTPCCSLPARIDAATWAGTGAPYVCRGCGWKWAVHLALGAERLGQVARDARHPHIKADRAEWESTGTGTRPHRRRRA